jgi:ABC-type amino acid transport substrate-binding protein
MYERILLQTATAAVFVGLTFATAIAQDYKLVEPGKLTIATTAEMPGIVPVDNGLAGYDGEILALIAAKLGLKLNPMKMEWSGVIASVQAGRMDVLGGNVAWTAERTKILGLTDPTQYFANGITHKQGAAMARLADLEGKRVATITGFSFIPELQKIKGIQLSFYDTSDAALRDLLAGRVDAVLADPPVMGYAIAKNPDWKLQFTPFADNNPDYPMLTGKGRQFVLGLHKDNKKLLDDMNAVLAELWSNCKLKEIGAKYGMADSVWFQPGADNPRAGADRPADWKQPRCQ